MGAKPLLQLAAGPYAKRHLEQHGLRLADFERFQAASGGPKWLAIAELDREIWRQWHKAGRHRMDAIGASSGGWRTTALACVDGDAAHRRLQQAYISFDADARPTQPQIEQQIRQLIRQSLSRSGTHEVLNNGAWQTNLVASQARRLGASTHKARIATALMLAAATNSVSRRSLDWHYRRVIFGVVDDSPYATLTDLPTQFAALTEHNLEDVLVATGSIPLLSAPVTNIANAPKGYYFDGGISDYHFDIAPEPKKLTIYPHFINGAYAGWFDKFFPSRKKPANFSHTLLLSPTQAFIEQLPLKKLPDRSDFGKIPDAQRKHNWHQAAALSEALALEFRQLCSGESPLLIEAL
ncbi:patatin-like phospholipase family protein [Paraferrimonas haliotis]|uniref:PNPLA domain-containing protein n=1 Tax=Paraferrimonas haliotis TaxID=2013866 RepID=A0AA37TUY9_9GAMM|nr:alpha/beta hydrolase [Paraferrimonas haliotis]GLS83334.1 hypothetical protein GCM10007894_13110 [Paraferrimonas haliotis]